MSDLPATSSTGAVFLSYASQDAEAAKRICNALRTAGVEVWFDQNELTGGDAWDQKIRAQVKTCALFVPIISAATQARLEGYFRLEWKLAAQRTHTMADAKPFLLPVVIDGTRDAEAHVPEEFRAVQWTCLPGGETPERFGARVKKLLDGDVAQASSLQPAQMAGWKPALPSKPGSRPWLVPAIAGLAVIIALALWQPWKNSPKASTPVAAPAAVAANPAAGALTDAQKLVAQARKVFEEGDELDRETLILADDLAKRALALDAAEPTAWLLAAQLSYAMVWQSFDMSEARKADLQRQAARARALAPESVPAQLALANARVAVAYSNFKSASNRQDLAGVEQDLLALAERAPRDHQVQRALGQTYRFLKRPDDALRALRRALELSGGDPAVSADLINVTLRRKRYAEAEGLLAPALVRRPTGRVLVFDVLLKTQWRGDLAGAQAALATWPGWLLREDRGAFIAWQTWLWSNQADRALDVAQRLPRDYLRDVWFTGPRAVLTARAHELAGHREAAQADWRTVVRLADQELAGSPDDAAAMFWKAWALSRLGDQSGAEAVCTLLQQRTLTTQTVFFNCTNLSLLWSTMGRTDLAAAHLRAGFGADDDTYAVTRAMLELDPAYAPLRADPHFAELAAAALAPPAAGSQLPSASSPTPVDTKSVAVLAFADLSVAHDSEYFSDGISEELLNVLAKVPGLKVTARTSAFFFKGKNLPIPEIGKQLGVAYVVEGSVQRAGERVKITAQLIKAADGFHGWSETFTRDAKDVFAVEEEIAGLIAQQLSLKLGVSSAAATASVNPEAYQLYLAARQAYNLSTPVGLDRAEKLLSGAVKLEPGLARAHAALSDVRRNLAQAAQTAGAFSQRNSPVMSEILSSAQQAVALDPNLPEAHVALGAAYWMAWKIDEAKRELGQAIALNPNYAAGHHLMARALLADGRLDDALSELRRAVGLDPLFSRLADNYSLALISAGRPSEALVFADRALVLQPENRQAQAAKAEALARLGRVKEALALARELETDPAFGWWAALAFALAGDRAAAERVLAERPIVGPDAFALAELGRFDDCLATLLSGALVVTSVERIYFSSSFDPIRQDPRFRKALADAGVMEAHDRAQAWRAAHPPEKSEAKK